MAASAATQTDVPAEEAPPHLGLFAQIARAVHLDVGAYDEVAADPRYGWKVAVLVVLGGAALGSSLGWAGTAACIALAVVSWLGCSSTISLYGSLPFGFCARAVGMAFYPLLLAGYALLAVGYPTLYQSTLGLALAMTVASIVAAIFRVAKYGKNGDEAAAD
jgi:hypothetical protein